MSKLNRGLTIDIAELVLTNAYKVIELVAGGIGRCNYLIEATEAAAIAVKLFDLSSDDQENLEAFFDSSVNVGRESHCEEYAEIVIEYLEESNYFEE